MFTRLMLSIGMAILLILGLCVAFVGQAASASEHTLSTADGLTLALSADGQVAGLQIDGEELVSAPAPALLVRDLSDAGSVITPNLVPNPGFETGPTGWSPLTNHGLDATVVVSPTHRGDAALQLMNPVTDTYAFAAFASDPMPVTPYQRYRVSAWWRSATGYVSGTDGPPTFWQMTLWRAPYRTTGLYVQWLDADNQPLDDPQLAVPLHWNAANWRLIRRELAAPARAASARVVVVAKLAGETLWVDDVTLVSSPEEEMPVAGTITPCPGSPNSQEFAGTRGALGGCYVQTAALTSGLSLTVTYAAYADHIAVHGEVRDLEERDRALDVSWGVPANLTDGTWWDDAHTSRLITDTNTYANAISAIYDGWLPISLYPYAGVVVRSEQGGKALALGLPLDRPQLALLAYDGASRRYGATYHLGISPRAHRLDGSATFDLFLYRFDSTWGFRDVIARHRALQPEVYTTTLPIYDYAAAEQGWYFTGAGVQRALAEDAANIYSAQYTVGELPLKITSSNNPRPTLDETLAVVTDALSSPRPWEAALSRAVTHSAVVDPNGDWSLKKLGVFEWAPDWWEAIWAANLDPDLTDGLASWILDWRITPAFTATTEAGAHLDGVQMDNFMSPPALDLRPEALAVADWPLTYTPHTYQPAVHNGFALREYLAFLRDYLDTEWGADRGISINFWGLGNPNYLAEYIDAFGSEGNLKGNGEGQNWNPEILDYRRAIAFSRPYLFANQTDGLTATEAYTYSQMALLYGIRSRRGPNGGYWEPEAERIVSDTVQVVRRYWAAGWEPLTFARRDSDDVWIERFGGPELPRVPLGSPEFHGTQRNSQELVGTEDVLYFTAHNRTDLTHTNAITIETVPLGLTAPATAAITDVVTGQHIPFSVVEGDIVVTLILTPRETRVLRVSGGVAPPVSQCVGDANGNGVGDVVDITSTAADLPCHVYLPVVTANWRQPWPTPTPVAASDQRSHPSWIHAGIYSVEW